MSQQASPASGYLERTTAHLSLKYRAGSFVAQHLEAIATRAEHVARYVHQRLKPLSPAFSSPPRCVITLEDQAAPDEALARPLDRVGIVVVHPERSGRDLADGVALAMVYQRFGDSQFWRPVPNEQTDPAAIDNALWFFASGLGRYLADQSDAPHGLFGSTPSGEPPRQQSESVVQQVAADRDGKVPLYESLLRGPRMAGSPPEYAALSESFCGYLFEREGAKAYHRLIRGVREDPNLATDLIYGKTVEQLQDEWLGWVLRGHGRRPVALKAFVRQIIPYLRPYTWLMVLVLMLIFLSGSVAQIAPFQVRDIVDIVTTAHNTAKDRTIDQNLEFVRDLGQNLSATLGGRGDWRGFAAEHNLILNTLGRLYIKVVILMLVVFVNLCAVIWLVYVVNVIGQNILRDLRVRFTQRLHQLGASFYSRNRMGDMLSRFTSDIARMADPLAEATAYSMYYTYLVGATIFAMFAMSWQLSVVLFLILPVYWVINRRFGPAMQAAARTRQERLAQLNAGLEEQLFGNQLIKAYGLGGYMMRRFQPKIGEYRKVAIWTDFLRAIYNEVIGIAENFQTKLVLGVGGTLAVFGLITPGTIIGFNALAGRFIAPLHRLGLIYAGVAIASASLRRVEEILRMPMEDLATPPGGIFKPEAIGHGIDFEHVTFSYTGTEPTLHEINLHIPVGAHVAFVGPTGAGKSTLCNLIPRFYDVDRGAVKIDGRDIREFSLAGLRQSISIVSQDTFIFASTVMENIRLGRQDATDEEVLEAAKGACLHDFIMSLPAGYDTLVGERGSRLSGGQKQRVSIARALLRDSPILILDEATSALDAETESEILAELDEVTRGKTVISITHRLGLAIKSDTIHVLQHGRIIQSGSHEELIRQAGLYRKLFEDQNRELMRRGAGDQLEVTVERVQTVPTFSMVPTTEVNRLVELVGSERVPAGQEICKTNGADRRLYLLSAGQVELCMHDEQGGEQRLAIGAPRGPNGEAHLSLLLSLPGTVSARAITDAELKVLDPAQLRNLLGTAWTEQPVSAPGAPPARADNHS